MGPFKTPNLPAMTPIPPIIKISATACNVLRITSKCYSGVKIQLTSTIIAKKLSENYGIFHGLNLFCSTYAQRGIDARNDIMRIFFDIYNTHRSTEFKLTVKRLPKADCLGLEHYLIQHASFLLGSGNQAEHRHGLRGVQ